METALFKAKASMAGPTRESFLDIISRLFAVCPSRQKTEVSWKLLVDVMFEDLGDFPEDILQEASRRWRKTNTFFPSIAELIREAKPLLEERKKVIARLETLFRVADNPAPNGEATLEWFLRIVGEGKENGDGGFKERDPGPGDDAAYGAEPPDDRHPLDDAPHFNVREKEPML